MTDEIDTFISDVSTTSTNIAIASRTASRGLPSPTLGTVVLTCSVTRLVSLRRSAEARLTRWG